MQDNPKIQELVQCFEDFGNMQDGMEARGPLYRAQDLQKEMPPEDFYSGLQKAAINAFQTAHVGVVEEILEIDPKIAEDIHVRRSAKRYFAENQSSGIEIDEDLKKLFEA